VETKSSYCVQNSPPLDSVLSQLNPTHILTPYFLKIHFNSLQSVSSLQAFCLKCCMDSSSPHAWYMLCPDIYFDTNYQATSWFREGSSIPFSILGGGVGVDSLNILRRCFWNMCRISTMLFGTWGRWYAMTLDMLLLCPSQTTSYLSFDDIQSQNKITI